MAKTKQNKDTRIYIRVSKPLKDHIGTYCADMKLDSSKWIRSLLESASGFKP